MSRFQVGGLALIIKGRVNDTNVGKTVELVSHEGNYFNNSVDCWRIKCNDLLLFPTGLLSHTAVIETYRLMPLGDKQTMDKLRNEAVKNKVSFRKSNIFTIKG